MGHRSALDQAKGLEHRVLKACNEHLPPGSGVLLAVSGGLDSVVLTHLLMKWRRALKIELAVAHVHHGPGGALQSKYRERARSLAAQLAAEVDGLWFTNESAPSGKLKSEGDLREFRRGHLLQWCQEWALTKSLPVWIATAHTADDLLETRLMRLIRGTGADGLMAMTVADRPWIRPLLRESKATLAAYARQRRLKWVEDPSNRDLDPLRNWIRRKWLVELKRRVSSGPGQVARSLALIAEQLQERQNLSDVLDRERGISRTKLLTLSLPDQRRAVAQYLRHAGMPSYTQGHIEEILKRLDTGRRELNFNLLGRRWRVDAHWICVQS